MRFPGGALHTFAVIAAMFSVTCTTEDEPVGVAEQEVAVTWTNVVGATATANNLVKTAAQGWGNSGAVSVQSISSDGFAEFTTNEVNRSKGAGLSVGDSNQDHKDIDFEILLGANARVSVFEFGVLVGQFNTYAANDVFRVEVVERTVRYKQNGVVFHTSNKTPLFPLVLDTALFHTGATISNAQVSDLVFTSTSGVSVAANSLTKTAADGDGNAGAVSVRTIKADTGFVEFSSGEANREKVVGFSNTDPNTASASIQFGIALRRDGTVDVLESGIVRGSFGAYAANDIFRVEIVSGGQIQYKRNGAVFFTSSGTPTYPLFLDAALIDQGSTVTSVVVNDTFWASVFGADPIGSSLFDISGVNGVFNTSGAVSSGTLLSGNGFVEFTTRETNKSKALGLSNGNTNNDLDDIDFGVLLGSASTGEIRENGVKKSTSFTYVAGDVFRIEVTANVVTYRKNGTLLFTSTNTPTFPLLVDTALRDTGGTLLNVAFTQSVVSNVPRDPISGYAIPVTQAEWNAVFAAAGVTPKAVNQSWTLQDASGNAQATIGAPLTASTGAAALDYQQVVAGWQRRSINFSEAGSEFLFQVKAVGPDPTVESVLSFVYAGVPTAPASTRRILAITGSANDEVLLSMTNAGQYRVVCDGISTVGTATATGIVRPLMLQYNRTASQMRAYTDQEVISGTFSTAITSSTKGLGMANGSGTTASQQNLLAATFRGADAEWTEAEMRAVYNVLLPIGTTVPW